MSGRRDVEREGGRGEVPITVFTRKEIVFQIRCKRSQHQLSY